MIDTEKLELEFYKNGSAEGVLKRFVFSVKEEKLVRDAIRTVQLANPRMKLIRVSDELLREVTKTREPILPTEKTKVSVESMAKLELMRLSASKKQVEAGYDNKIPTFFGFKSKYGVVLMVLLAIGMMAVEYFKMKPINDEMQRQENLMHGISK